MGRCGVPGSAYDAHVCLYQSVARLSPRMNLFKDTPAQGATNSYLKHVHKKKLKIMELYCTFATGTYDEAGLRLPFSCQALRTLQKFSTIEPSNTCLLSTARVSNSRATPSSEVLRFTLLYLRAVPRKIYTECRHAETAT